MPASAAEELAIVKRDPGMAKFLGHHDFLAMATLRSHLYGKQLRAASQAGAKPATPRPRQLTEAEIETLITHYAAKYDARAIAVPVAPRRSQLTAAEELEMDIAFGIEPVSSGAVRHSGVVMSFGAPTAGPNRGGRDNSAQLSRVADYVRMLEAQ